MRIKQDPLPFKPITLTIETREEAEALIGLADKVCACASSCDKEIGSDDITAGEHKLAIAISNAFTECVVSA